MIALPTLPTTVKFHLIFHRKDFIIIFDTTEYATRRTVACPVWIIHCQLCAGVGGQSSG